MNIDEKIKKASKRDIAATLLAIEDDGYINEIDENIYQMTCPKCKSHTLQVNTNIQMCRCKCGLYGNLIDVVKAAYRLTTIEAADFLSNEFLDETLLAKHNDVLYEIHKDTASFYYKRLREGDKDAKEALSYLLGKRKMSKESIKAAAIGYAGPKGNELYRYLKEKYPEEAIKESGLVKYSEKGTYDFFRNRIIFPIMDTQNRVIGFGGRVMSDIKPKYLNSPESRIFIKSKVLYGMNQAFKSGKDYMLVCEGYMDTIALQSAGYLNAIASLGTALTEHHIFLIKKYAKTAYFLYDNDEAGIKAAFRGIELANAVGLEVKVVNLNPYKDPDEFISNMGKNAFNKRIQEAINSTEFMKEHEDLKKEKKIKENK